MNTAREFAARHKKALLAISVFILGCLCVGFDNGDVWFMDVHAQDMLENGFYGSVGRFTAHDGLQVPHQKWAMCMLVHLFVVIGDYFGVNACNAMIAGSMLFCGLFAVCLYFRCFDPKRALQSTAFSIGFTFLLSMTGFCVLLSFRPHIIATCMCMIECMLLERRFYSRNKLSQRMFLLGMAICSLVTMWFHSTMWPLCLIPVLPYLGEAVLHRLRGIRDDRNIILNSLIVLFVMILAGCLNPLGFGQFEYMRVTAIAGMSGEYSFIGEMCPFWAAKFDFYTILWLLTIILTMFILIFDRNHVSIREWLFFLGSVFMSAVSVRLMIYFYGFTVPILCAHAHVIKFSDRIEKYVTAGVLWLTIFSIILVLPLRSEFQELTPHEWETFEMTADILEQDIDGTPRIFAARTYVASMMLWRGFLPVFDTRCEVYDGALNGGHDILSEVSDVYASFMYDHETPWDYLREHIFDRYDLDAMIFPAYNLPEKLVADIKNDPDIRTFLVNDDYVVCERIASLKQQ